ncbi:hypothetical protein [Pseudaminobacter salicylatoxidans]|uniref:hypothetical protein n=1 Tax=Pseudaminobacter salicylatoxidans TaxID=93369 RepID=UPI0003829542|nr:hypothetical protein [Pseudaminobacter salicylatoxidans]
MINADLKLASEQGCAGNGPQRQKRMFRLPGRLDGVPVAAVMESVVIVAVHGRLTPCLPVPCIVRLRNPMPRFSSCEINLDSINHVY